MPVRYCARCGGETGWGCLGGRDCDDNLDLLRDGVSPGHFRNPLSPEARTVTTADPLTGPFMTSTRITDSSDDEGYAIPVSPADEARYQTLLQEG